MKAIFIVLTTIAVVATGSALAVMNDACKSAQHPWCTTASSFRHHVSGGPGLGRAG
jgi:hypothetical protein